MGDSITAIVGLFVGAQLLVAGASKVSGFEAFVRRAGNQKFALVIVIIEILLASWSLVGLAAGPVLYIVLACFYLAGGAHCAFVVMSPTRTSCLCSRSSTATLGPTLRPTWWSWLPSVLPPSLLHHGRSGRKSSGR